MEAVPSIELFNGASLIQIVGVAALVVLGLIMATRYYIKLQKSRLTVMDIDTSCFKELNNILMLPNQKQKELINSLYEMSKDEAPGLVANKQINDAVSKLTMYSLFKMVEEGPAPDEI